MTEYFQPLFGPRSNSLRPSIATTYMLPPEVVAVTRLPSWRISRLYAVSPAFRATVVLDRIVPLALSPITEIVADAG
ncbi:hypothetical protein D3C73_749170 [compost metagenome]